MIAKIIPIVIDFLKFLILSIPIFLGVVAGIGFIVIVDAINKHLDERGK